MFTNIKLFFIWADYFTDRFGIPAVPAAGCQFYFAAKHLKKKWKSYVTPVLRMSTSSGCRSLVVVFIQPGPQIESPAWPYDCPAAIFIAEAQRRRRARGGFPMGFSMDRCQAKHQGLNLFSQLCFPQKLPTESFLSRRDSDWKDTAATQQSFISGAQRKSSDQLFLVCWAVCPRICRAATGENKMFICFCFTLQTFASCESSDKWEFPRWLWH